MSKKHHLRKETTCLNCGREVAERFCTHCGQENTVVRQSFAHLAAHILEDITHYDSGFWRTIKYLLFRPALLTREYLAGKRQAFVAPVRLYFFISFICFFLPSVLPDLSADTQEKVTTQTIAEHEVPHDAGEDVEAHHKFRTNLLIYDLMMSGTSVTIIGSPNDYTSIRQLDSMQKILPPAERYNALQYRMAKQTIYLFNHYSLEEVQEKFGEAFHHNLSKALFVFLPFFAFFIWLFHNKKKWYYFDHAIFSIHYFSFVLLVITLFSLEYWLLDFLRSANLVMYTFLTSLAGVCLWIIYYFYRAHHKFYGERWFISTIKSTVLLALNVMFIVVLLMFFTNYTMYTMH